MSAEKYKVLIARFPFGGSEHPDVADWLVPTVIKMKQDPRISEVLHMRVDDTPISMSRNRVLKRALEQQVDYVLMIDSDMKPDLPLAFATPFWDTAWKFVMANRRVCVIGVPYCGPPPHENVYVFRWATRASDHPNVDMGLEQYSREEASLRGGIEEVAALPTGLILIDMRAIEMLPPPWFEYEYKDPPFNTEKASTEDVFFSRNLSLLGVPQYVHWDCWAGHHKRKCVGRPALLRSDAVSKTLRDALLRPPSNARLIDIGAGEEEPSHAVANGRAADRVLHADEHDFVGALPHWPEGRGGGEGVPRPQ